MPGNRQDVDDYGHKYQAPYTSRHPIPTVQKYRQEKEARRVEAANEGLSDEEADDTNRAQQYKDSWKAWWRGEDQVDTEQDGQQNPTPKSDNVKKTIDASKDDDSENGSDSDDDNDGNGDDDDGNDDGNDQTSNDLIDTSEIDHAADPKKRRKGARKRRDDKAAREVTDPVTHLRVKIFDRTDTSLKELEENPPAYGKLKKTLTGLDNKMKSGDDLQGELNELQQGRESMENLFPPPKFDRLRKEIIETNGLGFSVGMAGTLVVLFAAYGLGTLFHIDSLLSISDDNHIRLAVNAIGWLMLVGLGLGASWFWISIIRAWTGNQITALWDEQIWEANRQSSRRTAKSHETETVAWLNSLLSSIWPLVNPELMTSMADTLEDVMQASLPKIINMVSIDDIGQGSESLRILGVKWLPTAAAARSVNADGKFESPNDEENATEEPNNHDEREQEIRSEDENDGNRKKKGGKDDSTLNEDGTEVDTRTGLEGEEGDFINMELALAYKARAARSIRERNKDIHMYMAFYLGGNLKIPIWVDVRGFVGSLRLRLQLIPDPPFFGTCLITFLGQPRVELSCIPLLKRGLNIMDLPLIKNFVQSSVDAAMSQYVAPRSLMLNLQDMLSGDDFKKDTVAEGILVVHIKRGYDFKMGDAAIPLISSGGSDPYVSVGWAKFGKALWSTRVLIKEMEPVWRETAYVLVTPEEINVSERLRVQLWDSDRFTADDDLGRIEVDLEELMKNPESNGQLSNRVDGFRNLKAGEEMPGKLEWQVGYFPKVGLQKCQFSKQTYDHDMHSMDDLEKKVNQICEEKLREVKVKKGRHLKTAQEYHQQQSREMKMRQDAMIMSAPPPDDYCSGIFSIQIHQITGMGFHSLHKDSETRFDAEEEKEEGADLPSAYCSILLNHKKIYKTRVKPSNPKPFYNASTEKFVSDWRSAEVYVVVRDSRVDEDDPIVGIVHLPLSEIFQDRTQISGWHPIVGGVGFGRIRLSLVWRSVLLQAPTEALGWDTGTLEVQPVISSTDIADDLCNLNIKCRTNLSKGKLFFNKKDQNWVAGGRHSLHLSVHRRYSSNLVVEFRRHGRGLRNKVAAFAILWLRDIPDEETRDLTLTVWKGDLARAKATCLDDCGEAVGHVHLGVKFWSGMGDAHRKWASGDNNLRDVMGVLDIARDHYELRETEEQAGISTGEQKGDIEGQDKQNGHTHKPSMNHDYNDDDDDDDSSDDEHNPNDESATNKSTKSEPGSDNHKGADNRETHVGLLDSLRDYKKHARQEQRQNRGIMQYKIPRTTQWALHKAERAEQKLSGLFRRHTREPGIETEV